MVIAMSILEAIKMSNRILVIGAQNIDIFAKTNQPYTLHDSNLASIHMAYGGVGRNIAENIKRLDYDVSFLTVFGDDPFSMQARQSLELLQIDTSHSIIVQNASNSIYLGVLDHEQDLYLGLNDMGITTHLNIDLMMDQLSYIQSFPIMVIDNNLPQMTIDYLVTHYHGIKVMDAVSAHKVLKLQPILEHIDYLKVNQIELEMLLQHNAVIPDSLTLIITNGKDAVTVYGNNNISIKPDQVSSIQNASGAGDAFLAGFIHGLQQQVDLSTCIRYANKAAKITLQSDNATSPILNRIEVEQ